MARSKSKLSSAVGSGRLGKTRRRNQPLKPSEGISKPAIRRLARRAGVKRMSEGIYTEAPLALRAWLKAIVGDAVVYADHARRFTLTVNDIILSLKKNGSTLYGYTYYEKRERLTRKLPASSLVRQVAKVPVAGMSKVKKCVGTKTPARTVRSTEKTIVVADTPNETPKNVCKGTMKVVVDSKMQMKMTGGGRHRKASRLGPGGTKSAKKMSPGTPQDNHIESGARVTPERAQDIQKSLSTFRDTVIERQKDSCTTSERMQDWVAAHMLGRGVAPCTSDEMEIVLGALIEKDAIMRMDGKVYFV